MTNPNVPQRGPKDPSQPNPAGHLRGNQRPEGMTDEEWEAERDRVNQERQAARKPDAVEEAPEAPAEQPPSQ